MTLRVVNENYRPDNHSVRVELTAECVADLEQITRKVLAPLEVAHAELLHAVTARDRDLAVAACRRLLAVALVSRDIYQVIERQPA